MKVIEQNRHFRAYARSGSPFEPELTALTPRFPNYSRQEATQAIPHPPQPDGRSNSTKNLPGVRICLSNPAKSLRKGPKPLKSDQFQSLDHAARRQALDDRVNSQAQRGKMAPNQPKHGQILIKCKGYVLAIRIKKNPHTFSG